jgi:hypothetical protein
VHALRGTVAIVATSGVAGFLAVRPLGLIVAAASLVLLIVLLVVLLIQRVRGTSRPGCGTGSLRWSGDGPGVGDTAGRPHSALGVVCALAGVSVTGGISSGLPPTLLGAAGAGIRPLRPGPDGLGTRDRGGRRPLRALDLLSGLTAPPP